MKKLLIVSQNNTKFKQVQKLFYQDFQTLNLCMSNKEQTYRFEAVVVYLSKETDANFVKDLVAKVK